jgi:type IV pilus assembly protein PilP
MRKLLAGSVVLVILLPWLNGWSQEEGPGPSQKTKEAIEKFKSAPSRALSGLAELKTTAESSLEAALGTAKASKKENESLTPPARSPQEPVAPDYSPAGKRDPFRPFTLDRVRPKRRPRENLSPLERYEIGQLKLVGIIWGVGESQALVEDSAGLGYTVALGTPIGKHEGKVKAILPKEIVIEEFYTDFFGAEKSREIKLQMAVDK